MPFRLKPAALSTAGILLLFGGLPLRAQNAVNNPTQFGGEATAADYNRRLEELRGSLAARSPLSDDQEYRIGPQDFLQISVFEAPELNRSVRVSANGQISMPLVGGVQASGLTARELEKSLDDKFREYIKEPQVSILVSGIESHPISVIGEVNKPGVFEVRESKTLLEMLSLAQGVADQAGDKVLVMRGAGLNPGTIHQESALQRSHSDPSVESPASMPSETPSSDVKRISLPGSDSETVEIDLKDLLESGDPRFNVPVYPGDVVKVTKAGVVYVVGGVKRPGGFAMKSNEQLSVLQAISLAEGLTATAAQNRARIIRTDATTRRRTEIPIDMGKILDGKSPDMTLQPSDIVFIPNSAGKSALYKGTEAIVATASGLVIFHP